MKINKIKYLRLATKVRNLHTLKWFLRYSSGYFYGTNITPQQKALFESLSPGDTFIDLGANVGKYTFAAAVRGARVHAYEPNSIAFAKLTENLGSWSNVMLYKEAAYVFNTIGPLFLHQEHDKDPIQYSSGSSLLKQKENIDLDKTESVRVVDIAEFILQQKGSIKLIKMDVEGAETIIVPHLIRTGAIEKVENLLIELHDEKNLELRKPTELMKEQLAKCAGLNVYLDWH